MQVKKLVLVKSWEDDIPSMRPEYIKIHVIGSDESESVFEITAEDGWMKTIYLPAYEEDMTTEITYVYYEEAVFGYTSDASQGNEEAAVTVFSHEPSKGAYAQDEGFLIKRDLSMVTLGDYELTGKKLFDSDSVFITSGDFAMGEHTAYNGNSAPQSVATQDGVYWTGDLSAGVNNISGGFTVRTPDMLKDAAGNYYDLQVYVSDISIEVAAAQENRQVSIIQNSVENGAIAKLCAYWADHASTGAQVLAEYKVTIEVFDKDGNSAKGNVQMVFSDLDGADSDGTQFTGWSGDYVESVEPLEGVTSPIYMDENKNKYKVWYALKAFGQIMKDYATLCDSTREGTVTTLAAKHDGFHQLPAREFQCRRQRKRHSLLQGIGAHPRLPGRGAGAVRRYARCGIRYALHPIPSTAADTSAHRGKCRQAWYGSGWRSTAYLHSDTAHGDRR